MAAANRDYILFGYPRSGTTWISEVLTSTGEVQYLHEPDNERTNISGLIAKKGGPRFPIVDEDKKLENLFKQTLSGKFVDGSSWKTTYPLKLLGYTVNSLEQFINKQDWQNSLSHKSRLQILELWNSFMLSNNKFGSKLKLIKTVHGGLLLEHLFQALDFTPILSLRHPAAIIKSMQQLNNKDIYRAIEKDPNIESIIPQEYLPSLQLAKTNLEMQALQVAIHHYYWSTLTNKYNIMAIKHEDLLIDAKTSFKEIFSNLNLNYNNKVDELIDAKNKSGSGYGTVRDSKELIDTWKKYFSKYELEQIEAGYSLLPTPWYNDFKN